MDEITLISNRAYAYSSTLRCIETRYRKLILDGYEISSTKKSTNRVQRSLDTLYRFFETQREQHGGKSRVDISRFVSKFNRVSCLSRLIGAGGDVKRARTIAGGEQLPSSSYGLIGSREKRKITRNRVDEQTQRSGNWGMSVFSVSSFPVQSNITA